MRICYASADFGIPIFGDKGASVHIQAVVRAFSQLGHDVSLTAPQLGVIPVDFGAELQRVKTMLPEISASDLQLAEQSDRVFKERRNIAVGRAVETAILDQHQRSPFDFIYERYSLWSAAGARAARKAGIPLVLEVNAPLLLEQQKYRQLVLSDEAARLETESFAGADLIYAVSEQVRDYCVLKGAHPARTFVLENGVDTERFKPTGGTASVPFSNDMPVIGFAGSLKPWHGLEDLVRAFQILQRCGVSCGLLLVGDGPMQGWISGYAEGAGISNLIHQTGWVKHDEIPSYIRRMDIATAPYPKMNDFYFSPLKLFEYLACGRAVVASDIGQVSRVIADGQNGFLTEPGNPGKLADRLAALIADGELRRSISHAATKSMAGHAWRDCVSRVIHDVGNLQRVPLKASA